MYIITNDDFLRMLLFSIISISSLCAHFQQKKIKSLEDNLYDNFIKSNHKHIDSLIEELLDENKKVEAIKMLREKTNLSLLHATKYVHLVEQGHRKVLEYGD